MRAGRDGDVEDAVARARFSATGKDRAPRRRPRARAPPRSRARARGSSSSTQGTRFHSAKARASVLARVDAGLPLAVVAEARGLEQRRAASRARAPASRSASRLDRREGAHGKPCSRRSPSRARRSCATRPRRRAGRTTVRRGERVERLGGRVLELGGDRGAGRARARERRRVGVGACCRWPVANSAAGESGIGVEHRDAVAQRARGHGEHAAQLAAAQQAERGAREDHSTSGSCIAATCSRSFSRYSASLRARPASEAASRLTAKRPALAAPASPMAKVATGMPLGICTIE